MDYGCADADAPLVTWTTGQPTIADDAQFNHKLAETGRSLCRYERARKLAFDASLFGNPSWDIFLDAFLASVTGEVLSVKAACLAASLPKSSALRHLDHLCASGLLYRSPHPFDSRS